MLYLYFLLGNLFFQNRRLLGRLSFSLNFIKAQQIKTREQQQLQMQQMQILQQRNAQLQRRDPSALNAMNSEGVMGQPSASVLAMKMYEERMKHPHSMDSEASPGLADTNRIALLKSATNAQGYISLPIIFT